jgi:hypothetical protein
MESKGGKSNVNIGAKVWGISALIHAPNGDKSMQNYLFIGGDKDGLSLPAPDDAESVQLSQETYIRDSLAVGAFASITFYRYEELKPEEILDLLVKHHGVWAYLQPTLMVKIGAESER